MKTTQPGHSKMQFDPQRLINRQLRAINLNIKGADFLAVRLARDITHRIAATNRQFDNAIDLLTFSNSLSQQLIELDNVAKITRFELSKVAKRLQTLSLETVSEFLDNPDHGKKQVDLIVSIAGLHCQNNLPNLLRAQLASMKKDGLLLIALPVKGTLAELNTCLTLAELEARDGATMRVDPFIDLQQAGSLLQQTGFSLPVIDREEIIVRYDDMFALISDLRAMGSTSALVWNQARHAGRNLFKRANEIYLEKFSDADGRIRASFCFAFLTAWSPHEDQPKPLKPGSAQISLAKHFKKPS